MWENKTLQTDQFVSMQAAGPADVATVVTAVLPGAHSGNSSLFF